MHIEKIEYGSEKEGLFSHISFALIILLTITAAGLTGTLITKVIFSDPAVASSRTFIEETGKLEAYLLFALGAIIYLYVKGLLQDEYVTTLE